MPPTPSQPLTSATSPYRAALWLNGSIWALLGVCLLGMAASPTHVGFAAAILLLVLCGLGLLLNLLLSLLWYASGDRLLAVAYLLGFLGLVLFVAVQWQRS